MFVDYQTTRDQAHLIGQKASHGCSYADNWSSIPFQRMPNVSLQPGSRDVSEKDIIGATDDGVLDQGRWKLQHRSPALQLPVQRADVLGGQERHASRRSCATSPTSRTRRSSGSRATCSGGRSTYTLGGAFYDGKGQPGTDQRRQPRLPRRAFRAGQRPQYGTLTALPFDLHHDLDKRTGQGADRSRARVQQGGGDARHVERRRAGQPALRSKHRDDVGRIVRLQPGDHGGFRETHRHRDHGGVRRCEPAAGGAQRGRDREALAGEPRGHAGRGPADVRAGPRVLRRRGRRLSRMARLVGRHGD